MVRGKKLRASMGTQWVLRLLTTGLIVSCSAGPAEDSTSDVSCRAGTVECDGRCVDVAGDEDNCGVCGTVCRAGQRCTDGYCQCQPGSCDGGATCSNGACSGRSAETGEGGSTRGDAASGISGRGVSGSSGRPTSGRLDGGAGGASGLGGGTSGSSGGGSSADSGNHGTSGGAGSGKLDGGSGATSGSSGAATCDLPSKFKWTSTQPLITPKSPAGRTFASIKDPTIVSYEGKYHVFATVYDTTAGSSGWKSVYLNFSDFSEANAASQSFMGNWTTGSTVAPQVFYFRPQKKWYLIFQWGARYSTNDDINNPNGWSAPKKLLNGEPSGALDFWVICDAANCHLFFSRDDGVLYMSKTTVEKFPAFTGYSTVMTDTQANLFEASNVYKVEGTDKYLLLVEAMGPRYFRSWTSTSLDGPWTPLAATQSNPFAGAADVSFEGTKWTNDISHGEMIRSGYDETMSINACNMQYLYQGVDPNARVSDYGLLPYRLGLLRATK